MADPPSQVVLVYPNAGGAEALSGLPAIRATTVGAFRGAWWRGAGFYHRDGQRYEVTSAETDLPRGRFARLLMTLGVSDPVVYVRYTYTATGTYDVTELREAVAAEIRADDDVMTQFYEREDLLSELDRATTFDAIAAVLRRAATDPGEYD